LFIDIYGYLLFFETLAIRGFGLQIHNPHISGILRALEPMPPLMAGSGLW
jgi:hypothetical protein